MRIGPGLALAADATVARLVDAMERAAAALQEGNSAAALASLANELREPGRLPVPAGLDFGALRAWRELAALIPAVLVVDQRSLEGLARTIATLRTAKRMRHVPLALQSLVQSLGLRLVEIEPCDPFERADWLVVAQKRRARDAATLAALARFELEPFDGFEEGACP